MGIPAAFRWLSNKYPKIISSVIEDKPLKVDGENEIPVDITKANPNGEEFDNLYLDMNGIVHPCAHPDDKPAPADEEEMMLEIFKYTQRVFNMVRPRKILMIAVDGVAPRAKMNQQRSRRFRTARDAAEKEADKQELIKLLKQQNGGHIEAENAEEVVKKAFDTNAITPGTPFMDILALSLRYWCQYKLNTDPGWSKVKVIISDATVPGEGEHKVMSFIRSQRASPDHDPNTRHVIYGLDADLIMLALATHEPHFRVLREDVFFQDAKAKTCKLCGQKGHEARACKGEPKEKQGEFDEKDNALELKPFIWLHVPVLKEYLDVELRVKDLPFRFDIERAIDDWIFMCCFVGNDFLPHLPALEIREHGIDTLTTLWKDNLPTMGGYVTKDGHIDLERAQVILNGLAKQEDAIFKRRKEQEDRREANFKRRKLQQEREDKRNGNRNHGQRQQNDPAPADNTALTYDMIVNRPSVQDASTANKSAASVLKDRLKNKGPATAESADGQTPSSTLGKRKADEIESASDANGTNAQNKEDDGPNDTVRLWEDGYQDRYYEQKFHKDPSDIEFRQSVGRAYVEGLAWVLLYYFQGCPSWEWFYPYHYAPFAADFQKLPEINISFEKGRTSRPFEQLMSVLPAASRGAIPEVFHPLMLDKDSPIIDFYPEEFEVDLNGKKMAWQGVALLPFIDMTRLLDAIQTKYPLMTKEDAARNEPGRDVMIFSDQHETLYDDVSTNLYSKKQTSSIFELNPKTSDGLSGKVEKREEYLPHEALEYPLERKAMPNLDYDHSVVVYYDMPPSSHTHKSMLLRGAKPPPPVLNRGDVDAIRNKSNRNGRSYQGVPLGRFDSRRGPEPIHYGPGNNRGGHQGNYNHHNGRQPRFDNHSQGHHNYPPPPVPPPAAYGSFPPPPQGWQPPPPGGPGWGVGAPPPPPPGYGPPPAYASHPGRGSGYPPQGQRPSGRYGDSRGGNGRAGSGSYDNRGYNGDRRRF